MLDFRRLEASLFLVRAFVFWFFGGWKNDRRKTPTLHMQVMHGLLVTSGTTTSWPSLEQFWWVAMRPVATEEPVKTVQTKSGRK